MSISPGVAFHIASGCICASLILLRCLYRALVRCRVHESCYRRWRLDDTYMALALLPLAGRTVGVSLSFALNPSETAEPATAAQAAAQDMTVAQLDRDRVLSLKLHLPGRVLYALLYAASRVVVGSCCWTNKLRYLPSLWMLKLCLLTFYSRFVSILPWGTLAIRMLRWFIVLSFGAVVVTTLAECRPLAL